MPDPIPLIDVAPLFRSKPRERQFVAEAIHSAFVDTGFAYILNHGVSADLIQRLFVLARSFFAESSEFKDAIAMRHAGLAWRGYFPVGGEFTSAVRDHKEGLYFGAEHSPLHPGCVGAWPMHGQNLWPRAERYAEFPKVLLQYLDVMTRLGHMLMSVVAEALGLKAGYFRARFTDDPVTLFRIFNYPRQAENASGWGVGEHTDMGFLTILLQDDAGGLEVKSRDGWVSAPPIPGTFVINIGDMLQRWTHGIYHATLHRVKNTKVDNRLSLPFFFDPNWLCALTPIDRSLLSSSDLASVAEDPVRARWDGLDLSGLPDDMTYGEFVWAKIRDVFPNLADSTNSAR